MPMETASHLTIPQLSYQILYRAVLKWLLGLNPRSSQAPLRLVAAYLAGLLWVGGAATCLAMAAAATVSHDALRRLLIGPVLGGLTQMVALTMVNREAGWLVIDDVVQDKTGPKIQGIAWLWSGSLERKVLALNPVVMGWTDGEILVPLAFRFWKPPLYRGKNKKPSALAFDGSPFRTKIQLALELLRWAHQRGFKPKAVLFDAYYLAAPVLRLLRRAGWQWVSRIKGNRKLKLNGKAFRPQDWPQLAKAGKAPRLNRSVAADLPGWGPVRIIAVRHKADKDHRFLVGSDPHWGRGTIERWYGHRWPIECLFRDCSQLLGLHDCQSRIFNAQENHTALVFLAYLFLLRQERRGETAGTTLARLKSHPASVLGRRWPPGVRRVKREHRRRKVSEGEGSISAVLA
jgi:hypothetical protein